MYTVEEIKGTSFTLNDDKLYKRDELLEILKGYHKKTDSSHTVKRMSNSRRPLLPPPFRFGSPSPGYTIEGITNNPGSAARWNPDLQVSGRHPPQDTIVAGPTPIVKRSRILLCWGVVNGECPISTNALGVEV